MGQSASLSASKELGTQMCDAAGFGNVNQVQRLHAKGASLEAAGDDERTPIWIAARSGRKLSLHDLRRRSAAPRIRAAPTNAGPLFLPPFA